MAEGAAYLVKQDTTLPRATGVLEELPDGTVVYSTESINYGTGDYVLEENVSPPMLEQIKNGDLDDFLESASREDADAAMRAGEGYGTFIPEHSNEAYILDQYGHTVVPREQVVGLNAAGNEGAAKHMEDVKGDQLDERDLPGVPEEEVPAEQVPDERPPGVPVGDALAEASGGEAKSSSGTGRARRAKPQAQQQASGSGAARQKPAQQSGGKSDE